MMRMMTKITAPSMKKTSEVPAGGRGVEWELRPGGMLVQKRDPVPDTASTPAPDIKLRVKYGSSSYEILISSQATFGELKKLLSAKTGLLPQDQKIIFKNRERDSSAFLDLSGVKNRSKMLLMEDPLSQERRYLEMKKHAKMEKAAKSISGISLEVDKLTAQVSALETLVSKGAKVAEKDVVNLIEMFMTQLVKLDGIIADGDVKVQRRMQVRRVQKCVETLDSLKIHSSVLNSTRQVALAQLDAALPSPHQSSQAVVVTTKWETFDSAAPPSSSATMSKLNWEFFD